MIAWRVVKRHKLAVLAAFAAALSLLLGAQAIQFRASSEAASACGQWPTPRPVDSSVPTPRIAPTPSGFQSAASPPVAVVGAWKTCFRPALVKITVGKHVQWQDADAQGQGVVLDDGTDLGPIRHVLQVRFNRPGTYHYHGSRDGNANGTIIVEGTAVPGPALEVIK